MANGKVPDPRPARSAKLIRERFPGSVAERMQALAWWDWDHDRLFAALDDFRHMDAPEFIAKHA